MAFTLVDFSILVASIALAIYFLGKKQRSRFVKSKIKFINPYILLGNTWKVTVGLEHLNDTTRRIYDAFPNERYVGFFYMGNETILLRDLDIIKQITVKDFDHFVDHFTFIDPSSDPLFFHILFALKGDKWRDMRNTVSPAFTGSKMKAMTPFIEKCAERFVEFIGNHIDNRTDKGIPYYELELKDISTRYANDVIASCVFGIESDSFNEQNNTFYKMSAELTNIRGVANMLKFAGFIICPKFMKLMNFTLMKTKVANFFRSTVTDIINSREKTGVIRKDMIHLLMEAVKGSLNEEKDSSAGTDDVGFATVYEDTSEKKNTKRSWTENEIIAQAVMFLFAGFDTTSTTLSFMTYELAMCPEVQKKLQAEIDEYVNGHDGAMVAYNDLHKLKYLDMVCSETLRRWPPGGTIDRVCTKPYTLPPANDNHPGMKLHKGDIVTIPIISIHNDPTYWQTPEVFMPERFSDENKQSIPPFAYLPFGVGPRSCVGNRFALMGIKLLIFYMMRNFDLVATPKSDYPLKIMSSLFSLQPVNGFWIGMKRRNIIA